MKRLLSGLSSLGAAGLTLCTMMVPLNGNARSDELLALTTPITFTRVGLESFFTDQFNSPLYTDAVMPCHFGPLAQLLHFSIGLEDPYDFASRIFDIFHTRLKDCRWVNALSLSLLLQQLPTHLEAMCAPPPEENLEQDIKDILYKNLFSRFTHLTKNPLDALNSIDTLGETLDQIVNPAALEISELVAKAAQKRPAYELQDIVTRFIESALEKVVWNANTQHDTWDSACILAAQLNQLYECNIIRSQKALNHLYWTILYRYGYFLQTTKEQLAQETFEHIKDSLASGRQDWLYTPELEDFLIPKTEYLKYIVWECITEREAHQVFQGVSVPCLESEPLQ